MRFLTALLVTGAMCTALAAENSTRSRALLTLDSCILLAKNRYPLIRQFDIIKKAEMYSIANVNKGYLPQVTFSAKATLQSEVTEMPKLPLAKFEMQLDRDQYQTVADVSQIVWDGGGIKAQKKALQAASQAETRKLETDLYALNERVLQLFFGALLIEEQLTQNSILKNELLTSYNRVAAYLANGVANQADLDAVMVESISADQRRIELLAAKGAYREMLSLFIGTTIGDTDSLVQPAPVSRTGSDSIMRPEIALFDAQKTALETQLAMLNTGVLPKISLFLQGGYGKPGLNMLSNDFSPFYLGGVRLLWNISNFYTTSNSKAKTRLEMDKVETLRETFIFNTLNQIVREKNEIDKWQKLIGQDDEIIALRQRIKKAAEVKVENGTLSVPDLLREISAENLARQLKAVHEIQLLSSMYSLKNASNNQE